MNPSNDVLFSSDLWENALAKFASAAHMTVKLFDADLRAVFGPIHPTPLFQLFDDKGYDPGLFVECVRRCLVQTKDRPAVIVSQVHGLAVVGTSLVLEGKIVGAAVGGYVLADFSQVSEVQRLARQAGIPFDRLWGVARQQQPVPQTRLIVHGELLQVLGDALLRENYRTRQYAESAAIVTSSDDAIVSEDLRGVVTSWNRGAEKLFGYSVSEAVGRPLDATISSGHSGEEQAIRNRIKRGEIVEHYETIRRRKDGTSPVVSLTVSPVKDTQGRLVAVSTIARDITERKHAEDALRRVMEFDEAVVMHMGEGLYTVNASGSLMTINPAAEKMFGWTLEELRGKRMHDITHYKHRDGSSFPAEECPGLRVLAQGQVVAGQEDCFIRKDGTFFDVIYSASPIREGDGISGLVVVFRDITERKQAEEVLRVSEANLQTELADTQLLHSISAQLIQQENVESLYEKILDAAVSIMRSDFASLQMLFPERGTGGELRLLAFRGFSPQAATFWQWVGFDSAGSTCGAALRTGKRVIATDVEKCDFMTGTEDRQMYLQTGIHAVQTTPLVSRSGTIVGMISTHWHRSHEPSERDLRVFDILARQAADLIERKTAQEAVRKSEEHYRILFNLGPVAVYSCDAAGVIQEFNHRAAELWGRTPALGDTDERFCGSFKLFRPDGSFMPHEQCPMAEVVSGRISQARDAEVLIERPDHTHVTVVVNIRPLKDQFGEIVGAINCFYDISERKLAEEALQRAHDELESLVEKRTASLRRLSSHIQNVQDEERRRIARELHDSAGQYLAAIKMNLAQIDQAELSTSRAAALAESEQLLDTCLAEIRTISHLLHPPMLDEAGLSSAATLYVEGFEKRSGIKVNLSISFAERRLPQNVEMVLFRALQESLTNVHRHSASPKVDIHFEVENGEAVLAVRDYGKGVSPDQFTGFERGIDFGVGLVGMRERVSELGGKFQILSAKPGTSVIVTIPTKAKQAGNISSAEPSEKRGSAA